MQPGALVILAFLVACFPDARVAALEARLAALEDAGAEDQARIAALETRMDGLYREREAAEPNEAVDTSGPRCTADGDGYLLPPAEQLSAETLAASARVVPHTGESGEIDGFRVAAIRRESLLASCGIENGDVVRTIGGLPFRSPDEALAAFEAVRTREAFVVEGTRRNEAFAVSFRRP